MRNMKRKKKTKIMKNLIRSESASSAVLWMHRDSVKSHARRCLLPLGEALNLLGAELLWTPEDANDIMDRDDMFLNFPELVTI